MGPQDYKAVPQSLKAPMPMRSNNSDPKSRYFTNRTDYFGDEDAEPATPLTSIHQQLYDHRKLLLSEDDLKLKIRIRILRMVLRFAATCIAIGTATQEGLTLFTYLHTRNHIEHGRGPWSRKTQLWTSILLFVASIVTVMFGIVIIVAYLISIRAANKVSSVQTYFAVFVELGHIALWIGVAVGYRVGKNGRDLWGWACSPLADKIQPNFKGIVDFNKVCNRGESSWKLTIASAAVQILGGIIWSMAYQRKKSKKFLRAYEEAGI